MFIVLRTKQKRWDKQDQREGRGEKTYHQHTFPFSENFMQQIKYLIVSSAVVLGGLPAGVVGAGSAAAVAIAARLGWM